MPASRRRKFAHEYIKNGFNGVQAVYAAGYSQGYNAACVTASRLLRDAKVSNMIEESIKASKMSADEVLERLAEVARTEARFSGSDVVKAAELLGKGHKLFTDRVETEDKTEKDPVILFQSSINEASKSVPGFVPITYEQAQKIMDAATQRATQRANLKAV